MSRALVLAARLVSLVADAGPVTALRSVVVPAIANTAAMSLPTERAPTGVTMSYRSELVIVVIAYSFA